MFHRADPLLALAIVLIAGVASGHLARRFRLPGVTGQILVGILLGAAGLDLLGSETLQGLRPITHFALGLIAVTVGDHLNIRKLRNAMKRLSYLLLFEATLTPLLVFVCIYSALPKEPGPSWPLALLLAALAVSTAPATIVALVSETRSKGVFVKTLVAAVALNNIACICLFEVAHTAARARLEGEGSHALLPVLMAPLMQVLNAAILGGGVGYLLTVVTRRVIRPDALATASLVAILFTAGFADYQGVSSLLSCLFLGVTLANLTPDKDEVGHAVFADFESAIMAVFFTLAGMELAFEHLLPGGLLALLLVVSRMIGKVGGAHLAMRIAGAPERVRNHLGPALIPQAGLAVGLMLLIQEDSAFSSIYGQFLAVGLTGVLINELVGPLFTRSSLARSGELGRDRPRLIDFIHEENILTGLEAGSKEEAIRILTDLLIQSHDLQVDREALLKSILDREAEASTCIGEGLALPHGILEEGSEMVGVMGISSKGLDFEALDGHPVHCMVLLATPISQKDRHLEVLAALARSIGSDRNVQRQLYHADTAAHACEILHAEEFEDFNYFLEDE